MIEPAVWTERLIAYNQGRTNGVAGRQDTRQSVPSNKMCKQAPPRKAIHIVKDNGCIFSANFSSSLMST